MDDEIDKYFVPYLPVSINAAQDADISPHLSKKERQAVISLIQNFEDCFTGDFNDVNVNLELEIQLKDPNKVVAAQREATHRCDTTIHFSIQFSNCSCRQAGRKQTSLQPLHLSQQVQCWLQLSAASHPWQLITIPWIWFIHCLGSKTWVLADQSRWVVSTHHGILHLHGQVWVFQSLNGSQNQSQVIPNNYASCFRRASKWLPWILPRWHPSQSRQFWRCSLCSPQCFWSSTQVWTHASTWEVHVHAHQGQVPWIPHHTYATHSTQRQNGHHTQHPCSLVLQTSTDILFPTIWSSLWTPISQVHDIQAVPVELEWFSFQGIQQCQNSSHFRRDDTHPSYQETVCHQMRR